jgi:hypothetical protein
MLKKVDRLKHTSLFYFYCKCRTKNVLSDLHQLLPEPDKPVLELRVGDLEAFLAVASFL